MVKKAVRLSVFIVILVCWVFAFMPTYESDNKPSYLIQYIRGRNGRPNWYYHKDTKTKYIRVKSKGKWVYCIFYNTDGSPAKYK